MYSPRKNDTGSSACRVPSQHANQFNKKEKTKPIYLILKGKQIVIAHIAIENKTAKNY